ncbi:hypothetical protein [Aquabacterium sp.]|uniref:hypothetical protein n=1 Tax=Aquabacterium sp. TaxID=1872578 RepID=UPI00248748EF|nr:hypothetical protein [Aquabacterium sp.]MDI1259670.1 hypothetical protein [Aquabacterium sp.]
MSKLLKAGLLCLGIGALIWLVTLWQWQTAGRDVSGADIVGQLFVLPVVLTAVLLLAVWGVARLRVDAAKPVALKARPVSADQPAAVATDDRRLSVAVVQAVVRLSAGDTPEQVLSQIRSGDVRPGLDPELQDLDGAPVFTARMPELDVVALRQAWPSDVGDRVVRALTLLQAPADQLLERVLMLAEDWPVDEALARPSMTVDHPAHLSGMSIAATTGVRRCPTLPRLTVRLALPSSWTEAEREHASAWLRMRCADLPSPALHVHALDQADGLWALLDQQTLQWSREGRAQWCLVLVADSAIDEHEVERRQAVGELFTGVHQTGRIPGEAAAGLLLATPHWPGLDAQTPPPARLYRPVRLRRDKSADAAGRVGAAVLQNAMAQALTVCTALPGDLLQVVADGDHRASRTAEVFEALQGLAPQLDPMLSVTRVGEACGDLGLAGALVPVVLATSLAQQDDAAGVTLAVLVQATHERVALALTPWTWAPSPAPAKT